MSELDHILWAGADLGQMIDHFEKASGVRTSLSGSHPGNGTRNALADLGDEIYLELIATDPEQSLIGNWGEQLKSFAQPRLYMFAVRTDQIENDVEDLRELGLSVPEIRSMSRAHPSLGDMTWRAAMAFEHDLGCAMPFLIDWGGRPNPSSTSAKGCKLLEFSVFHPRAAQVSKIYNAIGLDLPCQEGPPGLKARLSSPAGEITLTS